MSTYDRRLRRGRRIWNLSASTYYGGAFEKKLRAPMDDMALKALQIAPGQRVLDIGCGTGASFGALRDAVGADGEVVGFDYSPKMLARAEQRIRERGWSNVTVRRADIARESLGHNEYDAAIAMFSISAMPDIGAAVRAACDALRPGGRLFVIDMWLVLTGSRFQRARTRLMRGIYRATAGYTGGDVIAELRGTFGEVSPVVPSGQLGSTITIARVTKALDRAETVHSQQ